MERIAVYGAGTIGSCQATLIIGNGLPCTVIGHSERGLERCRKSIEQNWDDLIAEGLPVKRLNAWHAYITIIGRKDDMIVSAGENIYPVQVESILNEHPKVAESLVFGIPDPKRGSVIAALIRPSDPSLTEKEMKQFCMNHPMLAPYKRPRIFRFVKELPHNATGKLLHKLPPDFKF